MTASPPAAIPSLLKIVEAADVLRISGRTVRRLISEGQLPIVRVRGSVRIRRADLEAVATNGTGPEPIRPSVRQTSCPTV